MSKGGGGVNIPSNYTIALGSTSTPLQVDMDIDKIAPLTVNSNLAVTQPIVSQSTSNSTANSTANLDLKIEPLDVKVEPLTVDTDSKIDLKPVVVDSCQTIRLAPLPPIHVEQPYSQHFGFTYMGMEIFGFTVSGTSEMKLHSPKKHHPCEPHEHESEPAEKPASSSSTPGTQRGGGLRVRVNDSV